MTKPAVELLEERIKRIYDTICLQEPDRVPIILMGHLFPARYCGMTYEDAYYDQERWLEANKKFLDDFEPDLYSPVDAPMFTGGSVLELLGTKQIKWPGHGVAPNASFQFVENEYMKQEEYDHFLDDPSDFVFRLYLSRVFGNLNGFAMLPPLKTFVYGYVCAGLLGMFALPPIAASLQVLVKAADEAAVWNEKYARFHEEQKQAGYMPAWGAGAVALATFDIVSDMLRGMRGTMVDMFECPDKLLAAQDKLLPMVIGSAIYAAKTSGNPYVFIPLHRGADGFMSVRQFETFYWPHLKKLILALIDEGLTPCPFFEGVYEQRLAYLAELPKGKIVGMFDRSDLFKVKEALADTMCIAGGMPISMLQTGTPEMIKNQCRKMIDVVGTGGGFIMTSSTVLDEAKPELLRVWVDFTKQYGVYR